ncbi:hypothetical protein ACIRRA_43275 [Nocardia sp. NPDC101769]|uniref:hypothetical protein n=1 Tax=Nocardia sp. NPDC101769 TaxID=3364333 RepID=UPI003824C515
MPNSLASNDFDSPAQARSRSRPAWASVSAGVRPVHAPRALAAAMLLHVEEQ